MSRSRSEQLLDTLSDDEREQLERDIAASGRSSLHGLFMLLNGAGGRGATAEKEQMFEHAFGRAYTAGEDYLLRNELRLLNDRIYALLALREFEIVSERNRGERDVLLLRSLLRRGAAGVFAGLYRRLYADATRRNDHRTAKRMNDVFFDYLLRHCELTPEGLREAHGLMLESLEHLKRLYRTDTAENQHRRVVCERNLQAMGVRMNDTPVGVDADLEGFETPLAALFDALSRSHRAHGEEMIRQARVAADLVDAVAVGFPEHAVFGHAILASALMANHRYAEARTAFENALDFVRAQSIPPPPEMLFNHASTLVRLGAYRDVLVLLEEYRDAMDARPKLRFRSECLRCFCHIFLGDTASAFETIPPDIQQRPESEYQYFRFIYLILPYLNDDPEGALREARNFLVYFNRRGDALQYPDEKRVVAMFRRFYTAVFNLTDRAKQRAELQSVEADLQMLVSEAPHHRDVLYLQWLEREIERRCRSLH